MAADLETKNEHIQRLDRQIRGLADEIERKNVYIRVKEADSSYLDDRWSAARRELERASSHISKLTDDLETPPHV